MSEQSRMLEELRAIKEESASLAKRQMELERKEEAIKLGLAKEILGVEPGCVIEIAGWETRKKAEEMRVDNVDVRYWNPAKRYPPSLTANPKRKDGSWSKAVRNVCGDWKVVNEAAK